MKNSKKGMSLVEIIVSIGLISIVLIFLMGIFINVRNNYMMSRTNSSYEMNISKIIKSIGDDIENNGLYCIKKIDDSQNSGYVLVFDKYRSTNPYDKIRKVLKVNENVPSKDLYTGEYKNINFISYGYDEKYISNFTFLERTDKVISELPTNALFGTKLGYDESIIIVNSATSDKHNLVKIRIPIQDDKGVDYSINAYGLASKETLICSDEELEPAKSNILSFNANGGKVNISSKLILKDANYGVLPTPTQEDYEFDGWYTKIEGGELITEESIVSTDNNITLYAHWKEKKPTLVKVLLDKANSSSVTSYTGSKGELYTFNQATTTQLKSTTDYRYIGNVPNNYITFNNEVWRIIGVFEVENEVGVLEKRVKIVRNESIGTLAWDSGSNKWGSSTLYNLLNTGAYFNRTSPYASNGLTSEAKELIGEAKWYLGELTAYSGQTALTYYSAERSNASLYKVGKVGLKYASDYAFTYANGVSSKCFTDTYNCEQGTPTTGWMYFNTQEWTLTSYSTVTQTITRRSSGYVSASTKTEAQVVKPTVYLKADVLYVSGNGSSSSPYIISKTTS